MEHDEAEQGQETEPGAIHLSEMASSTPSSSDAAVALRNGIRLAGSLLATWTVALVVRFQLPRHLGPETFGRFNFCDAFTGGVFSFLGLGVTTYIMKEISVRPARR